MKKTKQLEMVLRIKGKCVRSLLSTRHVLAVISATMLTSLGCAKSNFASSDEQKKAGQADAIYNSQQLNSNDAINQNYGPDGNTHNGIYGDGGPSQFAVLKVCSDRQSENNGTNVVNSSGVSMKLVGMNGEQFPVQTNPQQLKSEIINSSVFTAQLPAIPDGEYAAVFCDAKYGSACGMGIRPSGDSSPKTIQRRGRTINLPGVGLTSSDNQSGVLGKSLVKVQGGRVVSSEPIRLLYFLNPQHAEMNNMMQNMFTGMTSMAGGAGNPMAGMMGNMMSAMMPQTYTPTQEHYAIAAQCQDNSSPLMIDLGSLGFRLSSQSQGIQFDIDGDGHKEQISWPQNDQVGILVVDHNENGKIDNVHEMFGDQTFGPDGARAENGFEALAKYDTDNDGVLESSDHIYSKLHLWFDQNRNGISEAWELKPLSDHISEISLSYVLKHEEDRHGNISKERAKVKMIDGSEKVMIDVWFLPAPQRDSSI